MKSVLCVVFCTFLISGLQAQRTIKGIVLAENKDRLPFVSIGIRNSHVGTISEPDGSFEILIPKDMLERTLTFSSVGFVSQEIFISDIEKPIQIILEESVTGLDPVVIKDSRLGSKRKRFGSLRWSSGRFMNDSQYAGSAICQVFELPFEGFLLHSFTIGVQNTIRDVQVRMTFHEVNQIGKPGTVIGDSEYIIEFPDIDGHLKIDMESYGIQLNQSKFFIVLEPLLLKETREKFSLKVEEVVKDNPELVEMDEDGDINIQNFEKLGFDFILFKISETEERKAYYRTSSFGNWIPCENLALRLEVSEY